MDNDSFDRVIGSLVVFIAALMASVLGLMVWMLFKLVERI